MKIVCLFIGLVVAMNVQAQFMNADAGGGTPKSFERVKVTKFKSGYGVAKQESQQPQSNKVYISSVNDSKSGSNKTSDVENEKAFKRTYRKAGFKIEKSDEVEYTPTASTILELENSHN